MAIGEQRPQHIVEHEAARLVIALALFILHHAALVIELLLRHRAEQVAHAVAFQPQRAVQGRARHGLEIIGAIEPGGAVVIGRAHFREILEVVVGGVFRAVEHQVFEQVGKAGLALGFVLGADIVPHSYVDDRRLAVFVNQHGQAVCELEFLIGNLDLCHQRLEVACRTLIGKGGRSVIIRQRRRKRHGQRKGER